MLCLTESDDVMPVQTFFDTWLETCHTAAEKRRRTGWRCCIPLTGYPQHAKRGVPQQLRRTLHPPLLQPGVDRQSVQATEPLLECSCREAGTAAQS